MTQTITRSAKGARHFRAASGNAEHLFLFPIEHGRTGETSSDPEL
jgi:hypothetical protein